MSIGDSAAVAGGLKLAEVGFAYAGATVLDRINLTVPAGQFVTLLGASGSGKSTLLRLVAGLQKPTHGYLRWNGQSIAGPGLERGIVFQDYALFPWLSVVDNVALAIGKARPTTGRRDRIGEAEEHLRRVGLGEAIGKHPNELSGGMRQRAAIARALAIGSPLLLMDEPFGALDPVNRARLQDVLTKAWDAAGSARRTVVFVTHDIDEALYLGDRVVILGSMPGRVIADLPVPFERPRQRQALFDSANFHGLREEIAERLDRDILERLRAA